MLIGCVNTSLVYGCTLVGCLNFDIPSGCYSLNTRFDLTVHISLAVAQALNLDVVSCLFEKHEFLALICNATTSTMVTNDHVSKCPKIIENHKWVREQCTR